MKNKKGFTLIELLVCIAIIGILAAMILPAISSRTTARAKYHISTEEGGKPYEYTNCIILERSGDTLRFISGDGIEHYVHNHSFILSKENNYN